MKTLVSIHGFLLSGWIFTRMEKYFSNKGYQCFRFNYPTRTKTINENAELLKQWLAQNEITNPDFICHSMGGLVCRKYFQSLIEDTAAYSKVVCLGSPFRGSMVARSLSQSKVGRLLTGVQANSELTSGVEIWPASAKLGVIAGNRNVGVGRLCGLDSGKPGDGTILVHETGIDGATDHIILPVTHSQMTFSNQVVTQVEYFLNNVKFNRHLL